MFQNIKRNEWKKCVKTYAASMTLSIFLPEASSFDFDVSGKESFDIASAQGAAITDAQIKWLAAT